MASTLYEPLSYLLEDKANLPIFDEFLINKDPVQDTRCYNEEALLLDFEPVCGNYNVPQLTHLTPPQSPPEIQYSQLPPAAVAPHQLQNDILNNSYAWQSNIPLISNDITSRELEDLILHTAQSIEPQYIINNNITEFSNNAFELNTKKSNESETNYTAPVVQNGYVDISYIDNSTESSSPLSPGSSSSSTYGSSENDDEWTYPLSSLKDSKLKGSRSKPYSRSNQDRKARKKEQNKNAATRYRQKKKAEIEILMDEEKELRNKNTELVGKLSDVCREVDYLKNLIKDLFKAKGLIK